MDGVSHISHVSRSFQTLLGHSEDNAVGHSAIGNKTFMSLLVHKSVEDFGDSMDKIQFKTKNTPTADNVCIMTVVPPPHHPPHPPPSTANNLGVATMNIQHSTSIKAQIEKVELMCIPVRRPGDNKALCVIDKNMSIFLHLQLLNHCTTCIGCSSRNCAKMLSYLTHRGSCTSYSQNTSCAICSRVNLMLVYHAKRCVNETCVIPHCGTIKLKLVRAAEEVMAHCAAA